jgi:hypothetical protein
MTGAKCSNSYYHAIQHYIGSHHVLTSFAVMGYKALHGVTWSYMALHGHMVTKCLAGSLFLVERAVLDGLVA